MEILQTRDNFSDVESKTIKIENITIMKLFSIIRSETIIKWGYALKISTIKCLLPSKEPLRHFILTLFIVKRIVSNTVISPRILCQKGLKF